MIRIGTSGFSFPDWVGPFYPAGTPQRAMFAYYTTQFSMVELDFTYYRMPNRATMASLESRSPAGFLFCVKAYKEMTHELPEHAGLPEDVFTEYLEALVPVVDAGKLGCILAQFPWGFKNTSANRDYLARIRDRFGNLPAVIEFRNREWVSDEVFDDLRRLGLSFCCVDEPRLKGLFPPLAVTTGEIGYIRFHGRNAAKWWKHDHPGERYDYLYSREELNEWCPKIRQVQSKTKQTFVLFNNCHAGKATRNARMMADILGLEPGCMTQGTLF